MDPSALLPPRAPEHALPPPKAGQDGEASGREEEAPGRGAWASAKHALACAALGQVLSLLVTVTAVSSSVLASRGVSVPASQSLLNYLLLALFYGVPLALRRRRRRRCSPTSATTEESPHSKACDGSDACDSLVVRLDADASADAGDALDPAACAEAAETLEPLPWGQFLLTSLLDVEGNYLVVRAFRSTSLTSVALLDCWAIPCSMLLSCWLLRQRYAPGHVLGVALCTGGLACLVFSDAHAADRAQAGPAPLLGDALVVAGSSLYAASNVLVERLSLRGHPPSTVLGVLGALGSALSLLQLLLLERQELQQLRLTEAGTVVPFLAFSLALFAFYSLVPLMLREGGAAFFNLSLLTSDAWAVGVSALWFHAWVGPTYFVALGSVTAGLALYSVQWHVPRGGAGD